MGTRCGEHNNLESTKHMCKNIQHCCNCTLLALLKSSFNNKSKSNKLLVFRNNNNCGVQNKREKIFPIMETSSILLGLTKDQIKI